MYKNHRCPADMQIEVPKMDINNKILNLLCNDHHLEGLLMEHLHKQTLNIL